MIKVLRDGAGRQVGRVLLIGIGLVNRCVFIRPNRALLTSCLYVRLVH